MGRATAAGDVFLKCPDPKALAGRYRDRLDFAPRSTPFMTDFARTKGNGAGSSDPAPSLQFKPSQTILRLTALGPFLSASMSKLTR
jgi:hypothetical protein